MRVFSPTNEYTILVRLGGGRRFTAVDKQGNHCLLVSEKKAHQARELTATLHNWRQNEDFKSFYEFFPYKGGIMAVFAYKEGGENLKTALRNAQYPRRAEMLRAVFALILHQNLPEEILCAVMNPDNLLIYPSGKAGLLFDMPYDEQESLKRTVRLICGEFSAPETERLYAMTEDVSSRDYVNLYEAAGRASDKLSEYTPKPKPGKLTLSGVKERIISAKLTVLNRVTAFLAIAAILAGYIAVGILFYRTVIAPPRADNGISSIGTVVIDDGA